jgi:putative transposase
VEISDLLEWFDVRRACQAVHHWFHAYAVTWVQEFTAEPDRVVVDEKQSNSPRSRGVALRCHRRRYERRAARTTFSTSRQRACNGVPPGAQRGTPHFRRGVLVDGMGYLTALVRTDLAGHLDDSGRNVVEKLFFQASTVRIGRFHETWNGGQLSAERWLTVDTHTNLRGGQALDGRPPVEQLGDSIQ